MADHHMTITWLSPDHHMTNIWAQYYNHMTTLSATWLNDYNIRTVYKVCVYGHRGNKFDCLSTVQDCYPSMCEFWGNCLFSSEVSSYLPKKLQRKTSTIKAAVQVLYILHFAHLFCKNLTIVLVCTFLVAWHKVYIHMIHIDWCALPLTDI